MLSTYSGHGINIIDAFLKESVQLVVTAEDVIASSAKKIFYKGGLKTLFMAAFFVFGAVFLDVFLGIAASTTWWNRKYERKGVRPMPKGGWVVDTVLRVKMSRRVY